MKTYHVYMKLILHFKSRLTVVFCFFSYEPSHLLYDIIGHIEGRREDSYVKNEASLNNIEQFKFKIYINTHVCSQHRIHP
jgi:hypothetical protein